MNKEKRDYGFDTLAIHSGQTPDPSTLARAVPVHRTSSYVFRDSEHASNLFGLKELGNIYTRIMNPTTDVLEKRTACLEGGVGALALASGSAAVFYSLVNIIEQGYEFVASRHLYGGTFTLFHDILPQFGINARFVDCNDPEAFASAINSKTRAIFIETIGNPELCVPEFSEIKEIAERAHVPLIVDSTFTTPFLFKPIEYGADVVVHSLTKWIGGHGTAIGGIVVDSGKFDWTDTKFRLFNDPEPSYHGLRFGHDLGELSKMAYILRMRLAPLRNMGACISPDNSWIFLQGLETLALRMERHCSNALAVARYLEKHPKVIWVKYPGLESDPSFAIAQKYFRKGFSGGVVVFGISGKTEAAKRFIGSLELFSHLANVGDAKSLVIHPASTTHSQLSDEQRSLAGIPDEMVRLSVGIEDVDDILDDLDTALAST
ncbi:MAG: O-acetylhomoserine aminocarboxypropyltransferase/cysteine synthase [Deltaproteobacteria bacterium]|nr:O-acetylhomoserine aminocarboxypropyltransferase/cysteine synthase [Deltaproteobacteria bacterium]